MNFRSTIALALIQRGAFVGVAHCAVIVLGIYFCTVAKKIWWTACQLWSGRINYSNRRHHGWETRRRFKTRNRQPNSLSQIQQQHNRPYQNYQTSKRNIFIQFAQCNKSTWLRIELKIVYICKRSVKKIRPFFLRIFPHLSIASVDGKQHLSVAFSALVGFLL